MIPDFSEAFPQGLRVLGYRREEHHHRAPPSGKGLARLGGNITDVFTLAQDLNGKRLELMTELVPQLPYIAVLWAPNDTGGQRR